jgi:acyl dehydratase
METVNHPIDHLPAMPGMLAKSLLTLNRVDNVEADKSELHQQFLIEAVSDRQRRNYHRIFDGFVSELPLALFYCMAQRTHLAQMLDPQFPWPAPGLVHVNNSLQQHHPIDLSQGFRLDAKVTIPARGPDVSPRRLRPQFTVQFFQDDTLVVTCKSTYQVMKGQAPERPSKKPAKVFEPAPGWFHHCHWQLGSGMGRRYARVSGDFNPIHLHPMTSRWFGFKKPIIHGMYMMARAQSDIEKRHGRAATQIDVTFKRPVVLPARVQLWLYEEDDQHRYEVRSADHAHAQLDGKVVLSAD